jgi:hypothetical protein
MAIDVCSICQLISILKTGGWTMAKRCTADLSGLDVRRLARDGLLKPGASFVLSWVRNGTTVASINITPDSYGVRLNYQNLSGESQVKNYAVHLAHTGCNLGGQRSWWLCPVEGCGRRVALLYLGGSGTFACRHCYGLAYRSQQETAHYRTFRWAGNLRERLGWVPGVAHPMGSKPKGMQWRTYRLLTVQYQRQANQVFAETMTALDRKRR